MIATDLRVCSKCRAVKPLSDYYRHSAASGGHMRHCKECHKAGVRANRAKNADYYRAYDRGRANRPDRVAARADYAETPRGRKAVQKAKDAWAQRNPEKRTAQAKVLNEIRTGRMRRQPCEVCGSSRVHAHHDDYSKPLEVRWLCPKHHAEHHKKERSAA